MLRLPVMGLGRLAEALGATAALRVRDLSPTPVDLPGVEMMEGATTPPAGTSPPRVWDVADLFDPHDTTRGREVMDALRAAAESYRALMAARRATAAKVLASTLHYGCQRADEARVHGRAMLREHLSGLGLTRVCCVDRGDPVTGVGRTLKERAVRHTGTGRVVVVPQPCRRLECIHCGDDVTAAHFYGALLGPVRRCDGSWDPRPMADRKLYVYLVSPDELPKFQDRYRREAKKTGMDAAGIAASLSQNERDAAIPAACPLGIGAPTGCARRAPPSDTVPSSTRRRNSPLMRNDATQSIRFFARSLRHAPTRSRRAGSGNA